MLLLVIEHLTVLGLLHVLEHLHLLLLLLQRLSSRPYVVLEPLPLLTLIVVRFLLSLDLSLEELHVLHAAALLLHPPSLNVLLSFLFFYFLNALLSLKLALPTFGLRDREVLEMLLEDAVLPLRGVSNLVLESDVVVTEHVSSHAYQVLLAAGLSEVSGHQFSCSFEGLYWLARILRNVRFLKRRCIALHFIERLWPRGVV